MLCVFICCVQANRKLIGVFSQWLSCSLLQKLPGVSFSSMSTSCALLSRHQRERPHYIKSLHIVFIHIDIFNPLWALKNRSISWFKTILFVCSVTHVYLILIYFYCDRACGSLIDASVLHGGGFNYVNIKTSYMRRASFENPSSIYIITFSSISTRKHYIRA